MLKYMHRFPSREVLIGNRPVGGHNPIRLQSMTNTPVNDIKATLGQAIRIFEAGADYVRISTPSSESVRVLKKIRDELKEAGFDQPLVADIHFRPELALMAARVVEKVRINPGNYSGIPRKGQTEWTDSEYAADLDTIRRDLKPLVAVCREYGAAIRIGTNSGSLSPRIVSRYGNTPEGLVQSTIEFLKIFEELGFYQTVVSLKASNPMVMISSYILMAGRMLNEGMCYPLHVGVTEAGEGRSGRVKSALGICTLLKEGIGDTIRVSLSEPPEDEIPIAIKMAAPFQEAFQMVPPKGAIYKTPVFDWSLEPPPPMPGGHKAIVIANPLTQNTVNNPNKIEVFDFKWEDNKLNESNEYRLSPQNAPFTHAMPVPDNFNVVWHTQHNERELINKLNEPGQPLILVDCQENELAQQAENLHRQLTARNIKAAIIARLPQMGSDEDTVAINLCTTLGKLLLERRIHGIWAEAPQLPERQTIVDLSFELLQAAGLRITQTEFISCPTCARTSFDLQAVLKQVKEKTAHLPGLKIAVMGCVVNGPGEMADADFGLLGAGPGKVHIYKGNKPVLKNIDQSQAAECLMQFINAL